MTVPKRKNKAHGKAIAEGRRRAKLTTLTCTEIGAMFGVSATAVQDVERSAIQKLRRHPLMLELAAEYGMVLET